MRQIFNRVKSILSSYSNDGVKLKAEDLFKDDLKEIIDSLGNNLNNDKNETKGKKDDKSSNYQSPNKIEVKKAYQTLGLNEDCSIDEIKSKYKSLIKQYHPDKVQHLSKSEQINANKRAKEINRAYNILEKNRNF